MLTEFMSQGFGGMPVPVYGTREAGLNAFGWTEIPDGGIEIGKGKYGKVRLAYKATGEEGVQLESGHLCALKIQPPSIGTELTPRLVTMIWKEIDILRGIVHDNIIDYFAHFVVKHDVEKSGFVQVCILMEYASAGNLLKELNRYEGQHIGEPGARYYSLQICEGIGYLHSKFILHRDLHETNVVLCYNSDGSKTCRICDFGDAIIFNPDNSSSNQSISFHADIYAICDLANIMVRGKALQMVPLNEDGLSREACHLIEAIHERPSSQFPNSVNDLKHEFKWFKGIAEPPIPNQPVTPLLPRHAVKSTGYVLPRRSQSQESPQGTGQRSTPQTRVSSKSGSNSDDRPSRIPGSLPQSFAVIEAESQPRRRESVAVRMRRSLSRIGRVVTRPFTRLFRRL